MRVEGTGSLSSPSACSLSNQLTAGRMLRTQTSWLNTQCAQDIILTNCLNKPGGVANTFKGPKTVHQGLCSVQKNKCADSEIHGAAQQQLV